MALNWNFDSTQVEEKTFQVIPVGDYRMRIRAAEEQKSSKGNDMVKLTLDVSGYSSTIWHYIVFMPDNPTITNTKLAEFWDSFGIPVGNLNVSSWVGKIGAGRVKHEDYKGEPSPKISYFKKKSEQEKLPAWQEPKGIASVSGAANVEFTALPDDSDVPF